MAYSLIEQQSLDLDLFFRDNEKYIHLASGGGILPNILAENDTDHSGMKDLPEIFGVEINPDLIQLLNLHENELNDYLFDFISMAKRGFYSYDKSKLGDFENKLFHLVAKPIDEANTNISKAKVLLHIKGNMPSDFKPFDLFKYCKTVH